MLYLQKTQMDHKVFKLHKVWTVDNYAWDWVAEQLNLTITGDYVPPVPPVEEEVAPSNSL